MYVTAPLAFYITYTVYKLLDDDFVTLNSLNWAKGFVLKFDVQEYYKSVDRKLNRCWYI